MIARINTFYRDEDTVLQRLGRPTTSGDNSTVALSIKWSLGQLRLGYELEQFGPKPETQLMSLESITLTAPATKM